MNFTPQQFEDSKEKAEELYRSIGEVRCPYFGENVHFNAKGWEHLRFKQHRKARSRGDQFSRFRLLRFAPEVLRLSRTVQGVFRTDHFERVRMQGRSEVRLIPVTYYEFIAVLDSFRIKVIVKQAQDGQKFFWSIIPSWSINKAQDKRKLHSGNPEKD